MPSTQPLPPPLDLHQTIVFFPTAAPLHPSLCQIPIHGWIYRPAELSRLRRSALSLLKHLLRRKVPPSAPHMPTFHKRAAAFLADNARHTRVQIQLGATTSTLNRSRANGHFKGTLQIPTKDLPTSLSNHWLRFHVLTPSPHSSDGRILLLPPTGLSVISDIDDTVKNTQVLNRRQMLRNTFLRDFASVPDMAALYARWSATRDAAFHYVSASPWHLFPFLHEFLAAQHFPAGTFHLRDFRLMPRDLRHTLRPSKRVKLKHVRDLLTRFPQRRFILVGDSGESDAALYAALAQKFPRQIEKIYIRNVTNDPPQSPRWKKTFATLRPAHYQIFTNPNEIV